MREEGRKPGEQVPGVIALRLKVVNGQIPEVEMLISRSDRAALGWEKIGEPDPLFGEAVPPAERLSREDLIKTANMYFTGMQQNDGKGVYPFAEDCNRIENGSPTTNVPPPNGQPKPDPKSVNELFRQLELQGAVRIGLAALRQPDSGPPLCSSRPRARNRVRLCLFRSPGG